MALEELTTPVVEDKPVETPAADPAPVDPAAKADPAPADPAPKADPAPVDPAAKVDPAPVDPAAKKEDPPADPAPKEPTPEETKAWVDSVLAQIPADHREKAAEYMKRQGTIAQLVRSGLSFDARLSELTEAQKAMVKIPGKDAKPEEIEAYHKARGVPDKADDYKLPEDENSPFDAVANPVVKQIAKEGGWTQADLDTGMKILDKVTELQNAELAVQVKRAGEVCADALRLEWGVKEYQPTLNLIDRFINEEVSKYMSKEERVAFFDDRHASGMSARGENPGFVKFLGALARNWADAGSIMLDGPAGGADYEAERKEIMGWMTTDEERYKKPETQKRLKDIIAWENRRKQGAA